MNPPTEGLMHALLKVQSEVGTLRKDGVNPHFNSKFTPLDTIMETVGPLLFANGLVWTTLPGRDEGGPNLTYRLIHAPTGEVLEGTMPLLLTKQDPQGLGSALTYARRYSLTAVLNLVADEDDDGNAGSRQAKTASPRPQSAPANGTERPASAKQRGLLNARADEAGLSNTQFANAILTASGAEAREFDSEDEASKLVKKWLDRLPARLVDPVLEQFKVAA